MSPFNALTSIKCFIFDVDGVLTNGKLLVTEEGHLLRQMSIRDGYALQLAIKKGYKIAIISGGTSNGVKKRLEKLGITEIHMGIENKWEVFEQVVQKFQLTLDEIAYMGDDIPDLKILQHVGLPACPKDATQEVLEISKYISNFNGGEHCVRDLIEKVLKLNNHWLD